MIPKSLISSGVVRCIRIHISQIQSPGRLLLVSVTRSIWAATSVFIAIAMRPRRLAPMAVPACGCTSPHNQPKSPHPRILSQTYRPVACKGASVANYIIGRIAIAIPTLILLTLAAFLLNSAARGDPAELALRQAGIEPTPELIAEYRSRMGLDDTFAPPIRHLAERRGPRGLRPILPR